MGLELITSPSFDPEKYVKSTEARIYAIDLHWVLHGNGAIKLADMCKKFHPNSSIVIGGFTVTLFDKEILSKHSSIDIES